VCGGKQLDPRIYSHTAGLTSIQDSAIHMSRQKPRSIKAFALVCHVSPDAVAFDYGAVL
jgi:hypothetical protein